MNNEYKNLIIQIISMKVDLHSHTNYSFDATCPPEKYVKTAKQRGLNSIAITDHNTTRGWKKTIEAGKKYGLPIIKGEEIRLLSGREKIGEFIGIFLNEEIKPGNPLDVIDEIRRQGGLILIPHPFDPHREFKGLGVFIKLVDGIEVFNSRVIKDSENQKALEFARKHKLAQIGGSDAHSCMEIGNAYTHADTESLEGFRKALKKKKTRAFGRRSGIWVHAISTLAKIKSL